MNSTKGYLLVNNKKQEYSLNLQKSGLVRLFCPSAKIDQDFLPEDIPALMIDLPNLIQAERDYKQKQSETIQFRVSSTDKKKIEKKARELGYQSVSGYARDLVTG